MKIALIKPPATYADWYKRPSLGISYIAACLESRGLECKIFDAYFHSWPEKELVRRVREYTPDIAGLTAMTHEIPAAGRIAQELKNQMNIPVMIGGCHVTALPGKTLEEFSVFDYGIFSEGEITTKELLEALEHGGRNDLGRIPGLAYRDRGQIHVNGPRPFLSSDELDRLPFPAMHHYYGSNTNALKHKDSSYVMFTSRGCPNRCAFCMRVLGNHVRWRSVQSICQEIEYAIQHYGAHTINFADEIFLFDNQHTRDVLQAMIAKGLPKKIKWRGQARANQVKPELMALAKKAGCYLLGMGVESGDDEVLSTIGKGITVEQVKNAVRIIKKSGIALGTYFILGHPGETENTVKKTVDLAVSLNTDTIAVGLMVPYPGTKVFDMAMKQEGGYRLLSQDWSEYDKYCGRVLEIQGLPYDKLVEFQRKAVVLLYLKNRRYGEFMKYIWQKRKAFSFLLKKGVLGAPRTHVRGVAEATSMFTDSPLEAGNRCLGGSIPPRRPFIHALTGVVFCWRDKIMKMFK